MCEGLVILCMCDVLVIDGCLWVCYIKYLFLRMKFLAVL